MEAPLILVGSPNDPVENNCAYPTPIDTSPNARASDDETWQMAPHLHRATLPDEYELVCAPLAGSHILALNRSAQAILDSFAMPRLLRSPAPVAGVSAQQAVSVALRLAEHRLLVPVAGLPPPAGESAPNTLTAWLHVTNACNLRCSYCYVPKTDEMMDEATGAQAVEAVFRAAIRHGYRAVKLKYAGGEATLNFKLVQMLHQRAATLAEQTGLALHETVLSNGVALTRAMLAYIGQTGMRLMISLDGVGVAHDRQRVFVNGRGSFQQVERSIDRALAAGVLPDISITITSQNADQLDETVAFALDRGLRFNLNFYRENECSVGETSLAAKNERIIAGARAAFAVIAQRVPRYRLIDGLVDRSVFQGRHTRACGAGHDYMVVDHHGHVMRCQMELERPVATIAAPDPLLAIRLEPSGFRNRSVDDKQGCRDCRWRYWCGGGCSFLTYRATGRDDVKSPYCDVYQALYPDALYLEGLRLVTWSSHEGVTREVVERWV